MNIVYTRAMSGIQYIQYLYIVCISVFVFVLVFVFVVFEQYFDL